MTESKTVTVPVPPQSEMMATSSVGVTAVKLNLSKSGLLSRIMQQGDPASFTCACQVDMEHVMRDVVRYDRNPRSIPIMPFEKILPSYDCVLIIRLACHYFAGLYLADKVLLYISDNGNLYIKNESYRIGLQAAFQAYPNLKIVPIPFFQLSPYDYCSSNVVSLAMEFKRIHKSMVIPEMMIVRRSMQKSLIAKNYKIPPKKLTGECPYFSFRKCPYCGRLFRGGKRTGYFLHTRLCKYNIDKQI